jgi:hypothetical protein
LILNDYLLEGFLSFATKLLSRKALKDDPYKFSTMLSTVNVQKPQEAKPYLSSVFFGNFKQ